MAIDKYDGYEVLAKLLYPSIEASGNVYYGQTRKLTTDNTFGKNELNFDSHIETFKVNGNYESYFNWKIGPLSGAVRIEPLSKESDDSLGDYTIANFPGSDVYEVSLDGYSEKITDPSYVLHGVMFAKYKLNFIDKEVSNNLYSGNFNTYENFVSCNFEHITVRNYRFMDNYDPYTRSFYIEKEGLYWYLYIQVAFDSTNHITQHELEIPLTFTALENNVAITLNSGEYQGSSVRKFEYSLNDGTSWTDCSNQETVSLNNIGNTCLFRCKDATHMQYPIINYWETGFTNQFAKFSISGQVKLSGNVNSMLQSEFSTITSLNKNDFYGMFANCTSIKSAPFLPATTLDLSCYENMFRGCTSLTLPPELPATELGKHCYEGMFRECTSLQVAPNLPATTLADYCYGYMFYGCTSLQVAPNLPVTTLTNYCYVCMFYGCTSLSTVAVAATWDVNTYTENWLQGAGTNSATKTIWCDTTYADYPTNASGIPSDWSKQPYSDYVESIPSQAVELVETDYKGFCDRLAITRNNRKVPFVVSSGSDSEFNGRGLLNNSTKFNMEGSFDENDTHKMDTYNNDGSYNQEIWGYKSFNSPAQFRNGIYGECSSALTYEPSEYLIYPTEGVGWEDRSCSGSIIKCDYIYDSIVSHAFLSLSNQHGEFDGYVTNGSDIEIQASSKLDDATMDTSSGIIAHSYIKYNDIDDRYITYNKLEISAGASNIRLYDDTSDCTITLSIGEYPNNTQVYITGDSINVNKSIVPENNNVSLGSDSHNFNHAYAGVFHGKIDGDATALSYKNSNNEFSKVIETVSNLKITPYGTTETISFGDQNKKFKEVYSKDFYGNVTGNLNGLIPTFNTVNDYTYSVWNLGALLYVYITRTWPSDYTDETYKAGSTLIFTISSFGKRYGAKPVKITVDSNNFMKIEPVAGNNGLAGKVRLLNEVSFSGASSSAVALVLKIQD